MLPLFKICLKVFFWHLLTSVALERTNNQIQFNNYKYQKYFGPKKKKHMWAKDRSEDETARGCQKSWCSPEFWSSSHSGQSKGSSCLALLQAGKSTALSCCKEQIASSPITRPVRTGEPVPCSAHSRGSGSIKVSQQQHLAVRNRNRLLLCALAHGAIIPASAKAM